MTPVFFLSNWYSGATLLAILLNNHRDLTCNGETFPYNRESIHSYQCSCGKMLSDCEFYQFAAQHMKKDGKWDPDSFLVLPTFSQNRLIQKWLLSFNYLSGLRNYWIKFNHHCADVQSAFIRNHRVFYEKSLEFNNTSVYIDGTKSIRRIELFAADDLPKMIKVFLLIRDGRGFSWSYLKNQKLPKSKLKIAAKAWIEYVEIVDKLLSRHENIDFKLIRYEDLCHNLSGELVSLCEFIGVDYDEKMVHTNHVYHILGNAMRKKFDGTIREDLSWKTQLNDDEVSMITRLMQKELKRFNYIQE